MAASGSAHAHGGDVWGAFDPWAGAALAALLVLRPRRVGCWAAALLALFAALVWPLEALSGASFAAHMAQHMLLVAVAAPLLVLASPRLPGLRGAPRAVKRVFATAWRVWRSAARPGRAFAAHAVVIWGVHAPAAIAWMEASRVAHAAGHAALLGTAYLFWSALARGGREGAGQAALWVLATLVHTGLLGALLTFAPRALYAGHLLPDQQLGGLVMWVPGGFCYLLAGLACMAVWLGREPRGWKPLPDGG